MPKPQQRIRIHRFGELIAFDTEDSQTLYLEVERAELFAEWLKTYAADIMRIGFTNSTLGTTEVRLDTD